MSKKMKVFVREARNKVQGDALRLQQQKHSMHLKILNLIMKKQRVKRLRMKVAHSVVITHL
jgi:hypothetical protein